MKVVTDKIRPSGFGEYTGISAAILTTGGENTAAVVGSTTTGATTLFTVAQICSLPGNQVIPTM